jgi:thiol-disulfide isomerase/thioredoxin
MSLTATNSIELGFSAPQFNLPDVLSGKVVSFHQVAGTKGTLVMFICNHCPYVVHVREQLVHIAKKYIPKGIGFVAISSNDVVNYPADGPDLMRELAIELKFPFPYLYDESQEVAKAYDAACTPDFSLFDADMKCVYRGRLDGSRPGNDIPLSGEDLRKALDAVVDNNNIDWPQMPSMGCNIKWKK